MNTTPGAVGSRVFDVYCNGQTLLHNFDILAEGHGASVVKTFDHISPNTQGIISLQFAHVVNHPLVNAIEIVPEEAEAGAPITPSRSSQGQTSRPPRFIQRPLPCCSLEGMTIHGLAAGESMVES
jgi:hypothetical protein